MAINIVGYLGLEPWMNELEAGNGAVRLWLLRSDLESLQIAMEDYKEAKRAIDARAAALKSGELQQADWSTGQLPWRRLFHHAKTFVVCMRRFARLLETAKSCGRDYPPSVGRAISLAWKRNRAFFEQYKEARNAIEHIDGRIDGRNRRFMNVWGDSLEVVDGKKAPITDAALHVVEKIWDAIMREVMAPREARFAFAIRQYFVAVLHARLEMVAAA